MKFRFTSFGAGIASVLAILCFVSAAPHAAHAGTGLTVQPVKISQTMKAGDIVNGEILLSNASEDDVEVYFSVQDFVPTAGTDTFQFVGRAEGVTTVRDWITLNNSKQTLSFKKGDALKIPYTIHAPADAEPGSHFGVLFFKAVRAQDADAQIKVGTQVGILVFVTIPGKFEQKGNIKSFKTPSFALTGPIPFELIFENTGTVHFEPKGTIEITNMLGKKSASVPIEGYVVLPTGVKKMDFSWKTVGLLFGKYTAVATISDPQGNILTTAPVSFLVLPLWHILGFIVILVIVFFILWFIKTRIKFSVSIKK